MSRPAAPEALPSAPAYPLREKGALTRLMILRTLVRGDAASLRQVADEIGVTVQAVSEHVKRLAADGLVAPTADGHHVTPAGHEALRGQLGALKDYVDDAVRELARIDRTAARAGGPIAAGDPVGLFMEDGELVAYARRHSPSTGRAVHGAAKGADVAIEDLDGIIALQLGAITIGLVPDIAAGGSRKADAARIKRACGAAGLVVAVGPVAAHLAEAAGATPLRFGAASAAVEAAVRGVDVLVLVEESGQGAVRERLEDECGRLSADVTPSIERFF